MFIIDTEKGRSDLSASSIGGTYRVLIRTKQVTFMHF